MIYFQETVFTEDIYVFAVLSACLALIFFSSENTFFKKFYQIVPALLLVYLIPSLFNSFNIINHEKTNIYDFAKTYFLPAALFLFTIGIDFKSLLKLGWKVIAVFLAGTFGVIIGGPIALYLVSFLSPELLEGTGFDATWRGLSTIAGSWIGGSGNQAALLEIFKFNQEKYTVFVLVDIVIGNLWFMFLIYLIPKREKIDTFLGANNQVIIDLQDKVEQFNLKNKKEITVSSLMKIFATTFFVLGISHFGGNKIGDFIGGFPSADNPESMYFALKTPFFWNVSLITIIAILLSFTKLRKWEGIGASKFGTFLMYFMLATVGMKMNVFNISNHLWLFFLGLIWIIIHGIVIFSVAKITKSSFFYVATASQANIGGIASAPIIASMFNPSLAAVGVLLSILGYAIGTYGGIFCAYLMKMI